MSMPGGENRQVDNLFLISVRRLNMSKNHKSPSRIKYEQNHPTISARLPKDKQEKLLALIRSQGITLSQLLLHFIDEYEIKIMPIEEAKKIYMVTFLCRKCGKPVAITGKQDKEAAGNYMTEHGWRHKECREKRNL
jgi:hypothetical protein